MKLTALLGPSETAPPDPPADPEPETRWMVIDSDLVGENVIFCFGKQYLKEIRERYPGTVVYFTPELEVLVQLSEDAIRNVHLAKKKTKGWINPSESNPAHAPGEAEQEIEGEQTQQE